MNRNHQIKTMAVALSAGVIVSAAPINVSAAPVAGAVASVLSTATVSADSTVNSSISSGVSQTLSEILAETHSGEAVTCEAIPEASAPEQIQVLVPGQPAAVVEQVPVAQPGGEFANIAIANVNDYVNIRTEPSEESEPAGKLYANGAATVQGIEGEWVHITSGNCEGYIKGEFLVIGDEQLCLDNSSIVASVNTDGLNVREDTSTESGIISVKGTGDRLTVVDTLADNPEWVKVSTGDAEGFVAAEFVEVDRRYNSVAETKEEEEARLEKERQEAQAKAKSGSGGGSGYAAPSGGGGDSVASFACQFVGNPYVYGGSSLTDGTDCSGFVMAVYSNFGVGLPHSSSAMRGVGYEVGVDGMSPGDIVCYSGHVGIAIGGGQIVHASTASTGIKISSAYYKDILSVRRIF